MNDTPTPSPFATDGQRTTDAECWMNYCLEAEKELTAARAKTTHYKAVAQKAMDDLIAVTEQRNEARCLAAKYRNLSCNSQDEADETLLPWEKINPNEL
jgi:hypothetical protein